MMITETSRLPSLINSFGLPHWEGLAGAVKTYMYHKYIITEDVGISDIMDTSGMI